jgi:polyferredoxin
MAPLQLGKLKGENTLMRATKTVRAVLAALWGLFLALYVASKIHFFTQYDPLGVGSYLREHSIFWVAMVAVSFLIWLFGKWFPEGRQ